MVARLRESVAGPGPDRFLAPDIEAAVVLVASGAARTAAAAASGDSSDPEPGARMNDHHDPSAPPAARSCTAQGWPQEAALRMLQNNLDPEVAEHPDDLVVYGGTGKAARDWPATTRSSAR